MTLTNPVQALMIGALTGIAQAAGILAGKELGLSTATVSNVIHGKTGKVSPETARRGSRQHDRSIPGRWLPVIIEDRNCYDQTVRCLLHSYLAQIEKKPALKRIPGLYQRTCETVELILHALHCERCGDTQEARNPLSVSRLNLVLLLEGTRHRWGGLYVY